MISRKLPFSVPDPAGSERAKIAKQIRDLATEISRLQPQATTRANGEEDDYGPIYPTNFTKGLLHDENGLLIHDYDDCGNAISIYSDYPDFVEAINSTDRTLFEKHVYSADDRHKEINKHIPAGQLPKLFNCQTQQAVCEKDPKKEPSSKEFKSAKWRGWESPRSGHVYELQGPDAGAVGMAPAPRVGSSELAFEMAEVYALALLRDVPFSVIAKGGDKKVCMLGSGKSEMSAKQVLKCLKSMSFVTGKKLVSSTAQINDGSLNCFEKRRLASRGELKDSRDLFRGSTDGAKLGPYISQFMLIGNQRGPTDKKAETKFPGESSLYNTQDGFINYGTLIIDQRTVTHKACLDYMTDWTSWLDVQNGANFKGADQYEETRRFITTPRDLATYVHFDALYEAYLNAALIMLGMGVPASRGFPEPSPSGKRDSFATFGGPHILSLVTEVATRCLKAVRRQKFNYHRRCRPETIAGRLTLVQLGMANHLGNAQSAFEDTFEDICKDMRDAIIKHNSVQNSDDVRKHRSKTIKCDDHTYPLDKIADASGLLRKRPARIKGDKFHEDNLLLPMAFPEGSPMHPAYGAGHATVAGGCVTMLKAFFEMYDDTSSTKERPMGFAFQPDVTGTFLEKDPNSPQLTIQGELDKLAANISIGRNMAGVHYYSDYYDSLRMGERVAVGILLEQAPTYGDYVETTFKSFDGDLITISGEAGSCPSLTVIDKHGCRVSSQDWWLRHVSGQEFSEDL